MELYKIVEIEGRRINNLGFGTLEECTKYIIAMSKAKEKGYEVRKAGRLTTKLTDIKAIKEETAMNWLYR